MLKPTSLQLPKYATPKITNTLLMKKIRPGPGHYLIGLYNGGRLYPKKKLSSIQPKSNMVIKTLWGTGTAFDPKIVLQKNAIPWHQFL